MSCYQVHPEHIAAIVGSFLWTRQSVDWYLSTCKIEQGDTETEGEALARVLTDANAASVNARYPTKDHAPVEYPTSAQIRAWQSMPLGLAEWFSAVACFEYQACEVDDYEASTAARLLRKMSDDQIRRIPGYAEGPWSIGTDARSFGLSRQGPRR
jgi:hypothetical protein